MLALALGWFVWTRARAPAPAADDAEEPAAQSAIARVVPPPERQRAASEAPVAAPVGPPIAPQEDEPASPAAPSWPAARAAQLNVIRRSGPMERALAERATRVFTAWTATPDGGAAESAGECHREGCFLTFTFGSPERTEAFHERVLAAGDPSSDWPGPRQQLEPVPLPGGRQSVTWILLPPSP